MCTHVEKAAYAEEMRQAEQYTADEFSKHWNQVRERQFDQPHENWARVAVWYRDYEEQTETMLGCD